MTTATLTPPAATAAWPPPPADGLLEGALMRPPTCAPSETSGVVTLMDAAYQYIHGSGRLRTDASRSSYLRTMMHLDRFIGHGRTIAHVTEQELTEWCTSGGAADNTVKKRRSTVNAVFKWCTWKGYCPTNTAAGLAYSVTPGSNPARQHTWLTATEAAAIIQLPTNPTRLDERNQLIILLGLLCGLRAKIELARLCWSWFDPTLEELTVHEGKGNKTATIGVPDQATTALAAWHRHTPAGCEIVLPQMHRHGGTHRHPVWVCDWDERLGYDGIRNAVTAAGVRIGVPDLRPHDLRRSFAGLLEASGVPVADIQRAMRHSDVGTTSRYLDQNPAKTIAAVKGVHIG